MLVSLIRPPVVVAKWAHTTPTCPPIGLAYIAGTLRDDGHTVLVVDMVGNAPDQMLPLAEENQFLVHGQSIQEAVNSIDPATEVIGLSCMFSHEWPVIRELILAIRKRLPNASVVVGGEHITALPEFSLENCPVIDAGVIGEGEETMAHLLQAWQGGEPLSEVQGIVYRDGNTVRRTGPRARIRGLDEIPLPDWTSLPLEKYLDNGYGFGVNRGRSMPVIATRGCPYECTFCSNPAMWGTRWLARSPELVFEEMMTYKRIYDIQNFDFYDLTAIVKKDWIKQFCSIIIDSGEKFTWQLPSGTRSEAIDEEVSGLLYKSGCRNMTYAPESGSPRVLKLIKKKINLSHMLKSMRSAVRQGVNCKANIIIGFPGETHADILQTLRFCMSMAFRGIHDMSISPFSPYPGSELYDQMREKGQIGELTDQFFFNLAAYTDLSQTVSCSEHVGNRALGFYRLFGMALFYGVLYGLRPWRLLTTLRNVFTEHQDSRLEMSLRDLYLRLSKSTLKSVAADTR